MTLMGRVNFMRKALTLGLMALMICGTVKDSLADEFDPEKFDQIVRIFGAVVSYPAPSWQDDRLLDASEYYRVEKQNNFLVEQIPKGERFESWTKLYAVGGYRNLNLDFKTFVASSLNVYIQACGKDSTKFQSLGGNEISTIVLIFCENSGAGPEQFGYRDGVGEVVIMFMAKAYGTHLKVYQNWRGDSFSTADRSSWPVTEEELKMMINRFSRIKVNRAG